MYTPQENYFGQDSFSYISNDGELVSESSTVSLTVAPVNDEPVIDPIENQIINEIDSTQGVKVNLEGYYNTNDDITDQIMRPSHLFNEIINNI